MVAQVITLFDVAVEFCAWIQLDTNIVIHLYYSQNCCNATRTGRISPIGQRSSSIGCDFKAVLCSFWCVANRLWNLTKPETLFLTLKGAALEAGLCWPCVTWLIVTGEA